MATTPQLFEEPFDADEYIERLAWRTPGGGSKGGAEAFDPKSEDNSEAVRNGRPPSSESYKELKQLDEKIQRRVEKLEHQCHREAKEFAHKVQDLQRSNQVAFQHFQELDEHISYVATKVCHLGDQLEGVNTPRQRAVEAQRLMTYFNEFLDGDLRSDVFNNPEKPGVQRLLVISSMVYREEVEEGSFNMISYVEMLLLLIKEAADIIQKLHLIAQELPFDRFADVKAKIASKYHDLERQLIQEFTAAQRRGEIGRMREVAAVLLHFKGYAHCVDVYIKQCQEGAYMRSDVFEDTALLCQRVNKQVGEVFQSPETVMAKLIQNIFENKLQVQTTALAAKLTEFNLGSDKHTFLSKLIKNIFSTYLESYIEMEKDYLRTRSAMILQRYYDSKNHQKRPLGGGRQRTNLPLGPSIDTHGETFLSQEVVVNLLQETRHAFERCNRLSDPSDLPKNAFSIFLLLVEHLCVDHIDYALEIGLSGTHNSH
ncbi:unnamed protein product [Coregonus sp. 'balchen']|nr:unnamed protein product [Coregonus sp. 'balchen']